MSVVLILRVVIWPATNHVCNMAMNISELITIILERKQVVRNVGVSDEYK